jgi:hypothetical protein
MMRKGLDPERFKLLRYIRTLNAMKPLTRAIQKFGELQQTGMGKTWWERSFIYMSNAREAARESIADTWQAILKTPPRSYGAVPPTQSGPDLER